MAERKKSDLSRAFSEDGARKTHVGGQALIEGIMMRGKYNWSVAVREPSGSIYTEEHDLASGKKKNGWMYWPLVRGCRALVESLHAGLPGARDCRAACVRRGRRERAEWRERQREGRERRWRGIA